MALNKLLFIMFFLILAAVSSMAQSYSASITNGTLTVVVSNSSTAQSSSSYRQNSGSIGFGTGVTYEGFNEVRNTGLDIIETPSKFVYSGLNIIKEVVESLPELTDELLSEIGSILNVPTNLLKKILDAIMNVLGTVYDYIGKTGSTILRSKNKLQQCLSNNSNNPVVVALQGFGDCIKKQVSKQSDKLNSTVGQVQNVVATLITKLDQVQNVSGLGKTVNGLIDTALAEAKEILPTVISVVKLVLSLATAVLGYGTCNLGILFKEPSTTYSFVKEYLSCVAS